MKTTELKKKAAVLSSAVGLYHNTVTTFLLNGSFNMPSQGTADTERIGDKINMSGFKLRMILGQASDRPNVTFKFWVVRVPKGQTYSYNNWFRNVSGNVMLDDTNEDYVKVLTTKVWKPYRGRMENSTDQFTITKKLWIPYKKLLNFGPSDGVNTHDDNDLYVMVTAYDAAGTLITDNIAYISLWAELYYRDP